MIILQRYYFLFSCANFIWLLLKNLAYLLQKYSFVATQIIKKKRKRKALKDAKK